MTTSHRILAAAMLLATAGGACSGVHAQVAGPARPGPGATAPLPTREPPLLEGKLDGLKTTDGKNVDSVMYIANFPPGSVSARHAHPGWEYNYIIKGEVTFDVVGKPSFTLKAGQGMYNPRGNTHTVRNASRTEPAQLVSVLIKDDGAPVAVNVP